jgi:2'-5' RNA ligase
MRLFYAAFLDPENTRTLERLVRQVIAEVSRTIRPVPRGSLHQTLAFIGEVPDDEVGDYKQKMEIAAGTPRIPFTLRPPKVLSGRGKPRLVCADLDEGARRTLALQKSLRLAIGEDPHSLERRLKHPHITLARFKKHANRTDAQRVLDGFERLGREIRLGPDCLQRVELVKSTLTPEGPIYESIGVVELA